MKGHFAKDWTDETVGSIIQELAGRSGFSAVIAPSIASKQLPYFAMSEESDMHTIARIASRYGLGFAVKDGKVVVSEPTGASVTGQAITFTVRREEILAHRCVLQDRPAFGKITASWLDRDTGQEREIEIPGAEGGQHFTLRHPFASEAEAQQAATAKAKTLQLYRSTLILQVHGRPDIRAGGTLIVVGYRAGIDGGWKIDRVEQVLGPKGFQTTIEAVQEGGGGGDPQTGVVTPVNPDDGDPADN